MSPLIFIFFRLAKGITTNCDIDVLFNVLFVLFRTIVDRPTSKVPSFDKYE